MRECEPLLRMSVSSLGEVATRRVLFGMCNHVRKVELVSVPRQNKCQRTTGCNFLGKFLGFGRACPVLTTTFVR